MLPAPLIHGGWIFLTQAPGTKQQIPRGGFNPTRIPAPNHPEQLWAGRREGRNRVFLKNGSSSRRIPCVDEPWGSLEDLFRFCLWI